MISSVEIPHPVEYLPTGDHGLLVAWSTVPPIFFLGGSITKDAAEAAANMLRDKTAPKALICLEDGRALLAELSEFKFDYRYDHAKGEFVDVSKASAGEETEDADTDQEAPDDGSQAVPGQLPQPD